jgi:hypothetical protein
MGHSAAVERRALRAIALRRLTGVPMVSYAVEKLPSRVAASSIKARAQLATRSINLRHDGRRSRRAALIVPHAACNVQCARCNGQIEGNRQRSLCDMQHINVQHATRNM